MRITPESPKSAKAIQTLKIISFPSERFFWLAPPIVINTPPTKIIKNQTINIAEVAILINAPINVGNAVIWFTFVVSPLCPTALPVVNSIHCHINGTFVLSFTPLHSSQVPEAGGFSSAKEKAGIPTRKVENIITIHFFVFIQIS